LMDERTVALLHGCTGPVFFVSLVAFAAVSRVGWLAGVPASAGAEKPAKGGTPTYAARFALACWGFAAACYLQLVLGALVRHVPVTSSAGFFRGVVLLHIVLAVVLLG